MSLDLGDCRPYQPQSTTIRCVFVQTIQLSHPNGDIQHKALEAAGTTHFCQSFPCIKLPSVMMSHICNCDVLHSLMLIRNWSILWCCADLDYADLCNVYARLLLQYLKQYLGANNAKLPTGYSVSCLLLNS